MRDGIRRAALEYGLEDVLTLTLGPGARGLTPADSRTALSRLWNTFATRMRSSVVCAASSCGRTWSLGRGRSTCPHCGCPVWVSLLRGYVGVPEWHKDGTAHLHVAVNLSGLRTAKGEDLGAVQIFLQEAWTKIGGGFVWYRRGRRTTNGPGWAARYLSKYLGKMQAASPPWAELRYCTEDSSFRTRPWHRFVASRDVGRTILPPRERVLEAKLGLYRAADGAYTLLKLGYRSEWSLARPELRPSGRIRAVAWNPAEGSAMMPECDGHPPVPEWVPGDCHHGGGPVGSLGQCLCVPPWASEPAWSEPRRPWSPAQEWVDWAIANWDAPAVLDWWDT